MPVTAWRNAWRRGIRTLLCGVLVLLPLAAAAREDVTFILARDSPGHAFFSSAADYYRRHPQQAGHLVTTARSLAEVREFLARSPLRGAQPWGRVRLVAHGSQWEGLRVPLFAGGAIASWRELRQVLERDEFPPLPPQLLDRGSLLEIESCGLGRRPDRLRQFSRLLAGDGRVPVRAGRNYVWFGRQEDAAGASESWRRELPYSARVLPGSPPLDAPLREDLRRQWQREHGARSPLQFVTVPVLVDVPADSVAGSAALTADAVTALRDQGLRAAQLHWQREGTRLRGRGLIVAAAPAAALPEALLLPEPAPSAHRQEQLEQEDADHHEGQRHLDQGAEQQPQPGTQADMRGAAQGAAGDQFTGQGADEGAQDQSRQAEEETREGADGGTDQGPAAGADTLGPEQAGDHIGGDGQGADHTEYAQGDGPDMDEIVRPGRDHHAGEHQRDAGQGRQHRAQQADHDQYGGEQVQRNRHGADSWAAGRC